MCNELDQAHPRWDTAECDAFFNPESIAMSTPQSPEQKIKSFREDFDALRREIGKVIVGQKDLIDGSLTAAIAGGHLLIEGVPGLGKTLLARTLSETLDLSFQRIQFTPDLMPSDLLGTYVVMETPQGRRTFEFQKGPIFANLVLADQINRGTPRTQSALLEAMEGQEISVASENFPLPKPFFVVATQNPLDMEGVFPLPEPEIDRFMLKLAVPPPTETEIEQILERTTEGEPPSVQKVVDDRRLLEMREIARNVTIDPGLRRWIVSVTAATHPNHARSPESVRRFVRYGASPRGAQAVATSAKVRAAAEGRNSVSEADIRAAFPSALRHRLLLNFQGQAENVSTDRLIEDIISHVPVRS
jgi:MoxR-like ATPase